MLPACLCFFVGVCTIHQRILDKIDDLEVAGGIIDMDAFRKFTKKYPGLLFPCFKMQVGAVEEMFSILPPCPSTPAHDHPINELHAASNSCYTLAGRIVDLSLMGML